MERFLKGVCPILLQYCYCRSWFLVDPTQLDKLHNGMPTDCAAHSLTEFFCTGLWCDWPCWAIFRHYMCFHPEFHLFLISRHGLVWTRIRLATTRLGPQDQSYGASLYEGEVCPSKLQYFLAKMQSEVKQMMHQQKTSQPKLPLAWEGVAFA